MRDNLETYKIWAPDGALWTQWAKPVMFIYKTINRSTKLDIPELSWIQSLDMHTMIIVDMHGDSAVTESLALARLGYRPVPLFNGVDTQHSKVIVKVRDIAKALYSGADELSTYAIRYDAPPVFMLDFDRMIESRKHPGTYDNRWCVFPQDMPSAAFLQDHGIQRVIVRSIAIQDDLSHILYRYQEAGIEIHQCAGELPRKINITRPSNYKSLLYRFKVILGLTRNYAGGFGGIVPEVNHGGG